MEVPFPVSEYAILVFLWSKVFKAARFREQK